MIKKIKQKICNSCGRIIFWLNGVRYPFNDPEGLTPHEHNNRDWWFN